MRCGPHGTPNPLSAIQSFELSPRASILFGGLAGKLRLDPVQLAKSLFQLGFLLLQQRDLFDTLLATERQVLGVRGAFLIRDHLANLTKREAELLAFEDQCEPIAIAL